MAESVSDGGLRYKLRQLIRPHDDFLSRPRLPARLQPPDPFMSDSPAQGIVRPQIAQIAGYVPGEQPQDAGWVKLNTNENPYPPSPHVASAIQAAAARLHVYPDPLGTAFRDAAAGLFSAAGIDRDWIIPGNGSDEVLTILMRTFVDPGELVAYPYPSYILYETLAELQGATHDRILLNADWSWNQERVRAAVERAKLVLVPNPNSPSGNRWSDAEILNLVPPRGLLILDEAYGDFADRPHRMELLQSPVGRRIVVTRTFSKSYSLAGLRLGYAVAHPDLIREMRKVKDSYNCDALSLAAGTAALRDQEWMLENRRRIISTRTRLTARLRELGFQVVESQANFVWMTRSAGDHKTLYEQLKARKILVRYMRFPGADSARPADVLDGLRITIGTDDQIDALLRELAAIG